MNAFVAMKVAPLLVILLVALFSTRVGAWPTIYYTDAQIVERAELIVIARIKVGSIQRIPNDGGYEHHATLIVSRVIKGTYKEQELPITISYGLLPVASRYRATLGIKRDKAEEEGEATVIYEDNASEGYFRPSSDVHQELIWLLHRLGRPLDPKNLQVNPAGSIGVKDREDIEPLGKERDLLKYVHVP